MDKFVILITGSRTFTKPAPIKAKIKEYVDKYGAGNIILRHGNAKGADTIAKGLAFNLGIRNIQDRPIEFYNLDWDRDGLNAGNIRNERMLDEEPKPNIVLAFPNEDSKGTWNCIEAAEQRNIEVRIYDADVLDTNPHLNKETSIEKDIEFGLKQEYIAAAFFVNDTFPGALLHRLPEYADLDFVVTKNDEVKAFIEVKARRNSVNDYNSTMIAERKHLCARFIFDTMKIQTFAVIQFTDALVSFHLESTADDSKFVKRDDRDKGMMHLFYNHSRFTFHLRKEVI